MDDVELLKAHHEPGVLVVTSQPKDGGSIEEIDRWYDTEHGPARLKLGREFFQHGCRYKKIGGATEWFAIYEMPNLTKGAEMRYTSLRKNRSIREQGILNDHLTVLSRQFLKIISSSGSWTRSPPAICVQQVDISVKDLDQVMLQVQETMSQNSAGSFQTCLLLQLVAGTGMVNEVERLVIVQELNIAALSQTKDVEVVSHPSFLSTRTTRYTLERVFRVQDYVAPTQ